MNALPRWAWLLVALALAGAWWSWSGQAHAPPPGVLAPDAPLQTALDEPVPPLHKADATLKPLARFEVTARVLHREDYRFDDGAALAPVDLALGWGRMSDSAVLKDIEITQGQRFYGWHVDAFPIPRREIETHSANMHLIPADRSVERAIERARAGEVVHFSGYLVEADRPNGWRWRSSLSRDDTGDGACELVWVERFEIEPRPLSAAPAASM
ncbi:hypothetical protein MBSD_n1313 [Mizugakiibacter sediminis]|uniref:Uncharacterized protein n=1 Tax=Mizugakiibacter sediminis TaxID=1475481 RepID=A0A0K8QMP5_9GAMM|nr:hypothetical protein [Mizugakiibacter sediminis]GAP66011.1 hypothetical protein MBSD_n1313 [Mizugakiibacter sediminis]